jgi:hypothetical protein
VFISGAPKELFWPESSLPSVRSWSDSTMVNQNAIESADVLSWLAAEWPESVAGVDSGWLATDSPESGGKRDERPNWIAFATPLDFRLERFGGLGRPVR